MTFAEMALTTLIGAWIGSFLGSYLKQKGTNLATKEDIGIVVEQVAAVTATTKRIEGTISHEYRKWEVKKDALFQVVQELGSVWDCLMTLISSSTNKNDLREEHRHLLESLGAYRRVEMLALLVSGEPLQLKLSRIAERISIAAAAAESGRSKIAHELADSIHLEIDTILEATRRELADSVVTLG